MSQSLPFQTRFPPGCHPLFCWSTQPGSAAQPQPVLPLSTPTLPPKWASPPDPPPPDRRKISDGRRPVRNWKQDQFLASWHLSYWRRRCETLLVHRGQKLNLMKGDPDRAYMFVYTTMQHPSDKTQGTEHEFLRNYRDLPGSAGTWAICRQPQSAVAGDRDATFRSRTALVKERSTRRVVVRGESWRNATWLGVS